MLFHAKCATVRIHQFLHQGDGQRTLRDPRQDKRAVNLPKSDRLQLMAQNILRRDGNFDLRLPVADPPPGPVILAVGHDPCLGRAA
jgi:hypothetical protein